MLHIVLYEPEIPPNTGNLIRLCANTGFNLHLIKPLGFTLEQKALRRAGLDYHETAKLQCHDTLKECLRELGIADTQAQNENLPHQVFACTTQGKIDHTQPAYRQGDILLFGPETRGLPQSVLNDRYLTATIRIPMVADSRSLNLANAVSIVAYEAWRQLGFAGRLPLS
ncbi:MAG: tRNA (cytidine(34)-2'-O)-methyltransferase [Granulosicoccus sp.]